MAVLCLRCLSNAMRHGYIAVSDESRDYPNGKCGKSLDSVVMGCGPLSKDCARRRAMKLRWGSCLGSSLHGRCTGSSSIARQRSSCVKAAVRVRDSTHDPPYEPLSRPCTPVRSSAPCLDLLCVQGKLFAMGIADGADEGYACGGGDAAAKGAHPVPAAAGGAATATTTKG